MKVRYLNKRAHVEFLVSSFSLPEFLTLKMFIDYPDVKPEIEKGGLINTVVIEDVSIEHLLMLFYEMGEEHIKIH